ncbi:MAG: hypothetical protein DRO88_05135 [Promethearchaeia archaeon]|nr:MAG: hypothetical protein DRO88_05135 [Candidatus Lokiarchaeia archaeon]
MLVAEELILMSLHPKYGTEVFFNAWKQVKSGIAGALLMDLALKKRIFCRKGRVILLSSKSTGDHILNEILRNIARSDNPKSIEFWVSEIQSNIQNLQDRLIERMIERKIIQREIYPGKFGMRVAYPMIKSRIYWDIIDRIRALTKAKEIQDFQTFTLIYIMQSCGLSRIFKTRKVLVPRVEISPDWIFKLIEQEKRTTKQYVKELLGNIHAYISRDHVVSLAV